MDSSSLQSISSSASLDWYSSKSISWGSQWRPHWCSVWESGCNCGKWILPKRSRISRLDWFPIWFHRSNQPMSYRISESLSSILEWSLVLWVRSLWSSDFYCWGAMSPLWTHSWINTANRSRRKPIWWKWRSLAERSESRSTFKYLLTHYLSMVYNRSHSLRRNIKTVS